MPLMLTALPTCGHIGAACALAAAEEAAALSSVEDTEPSEAAMEADRLSLAPPLFGDIFYQELILMMANSTFMHVSVWSAVCSQLFSPSLSVLLSCAYRDNLPKAFRHARDAR